MKHVSFQLPRRLFLPALVLGAWVVAGVVLAAETTNKSAAAAQELERCKKCHMKDGGDKWHSLAQYKGVESCRKCHSGEATGDQYGKWAASKHAKAYEALASGRAKKLAAPLGIANPQTNNACLRCHAPVPEAGAKVDARFDRTRGVQCEICHNAAGKHEKKRQADMANPTNSLPTAAKLTEEIKKRDAHHCLECHNQECPAFQSFCVNVHWAQIRHPDPRKKPGEGNTFAVCPCGSNGCLCAKGECPTEKPAAVAK